MLEVSKNIILLDDDDSVKTQVLNQRKTHLVEGYSHAEITENEPYKYTVSINCDHSRFYICLVQLCKMVPEPFVVHIGEFSNLTQLDGQYMLNDMLRVIKQHREFITDCVNFELVLDHVDAGSEFQLYISDCKSFEIYAANELLVSDLESHIGISEVSNLAKVSEFPRTMMSPNGDICKETINEISEALTV
jgi:hypothetical protein